MSRATINPRQRATEQYCDPEVSILNLHNMLRYLGSTARAIRKNETY